jgi:urea transporter
MSPSQFRYILATYIFLGIFGGLFDFLFPSAIPEALAHAQNINDSNLTNTSCIFLVIVGVPLLLSLIAAIIGLFLFRPWAPRLAVIATVLSLFISPILGVNVLSGWSYLIDQIATILWGGILVLVYFAPLKEHFVATPFTHHSSGTPNGAP